MRAGLIPRPGERRPVRGIGSLSEREDRFAGALLGVACGDALGAPVEGMDEPGEIRDFLDSPHGLGRYTDDTQMTIALPTCVPGSRRRSSP